MICTKWKRRKKDWWIVEDVYGGFILVIRRQERWNVAGDRGRMNK